MSRSEKIFIQYIKVAEFEPFANFWATSAQTVSPTFIANENSITDQLVDVSVSGNAIVDSIGNCFNFIAGYAPNLTVYFQDSSEAHTFPISSYQWNFGDPFNEGSIDITNPNSNYYTITNVELQSGTFESPCWITDKQQHIASHTYIMPGTYNVTLTVQASCTSTPDICAKYIDAYNDGSKFYVYVEEILPQCNEGIFGSLSSDQGFTNIASGLSGLSPLTAYFMSSGIIAGSFPICRIDWDFGDGDLQTVTRRPLTIETDQGLSLINISAYPYDLEDPRNIIVPHIYTNLTNDNQTFDINISAYACNTNTMITCVAQSLVSPLVPKVAIERIENKKLIGSRFDTEGNLIYVLEGQNENTTFTVIMSGELN